MARVGLLDEAQASEAFREIFRSIRDRGGNILNLFKAMSNSPQVGLQFLHLGNAILFKGIVPPALRELAILRVGHLNRAMYEWTQHVPIALRVGVRQAQIDALPDWENSSEFNGEERAVLRYTDEETLRIRVSEQAFTAVRGFLSDEGIVELTTTIGYYGMVCRILETLQVELEQGKREG